MLQRKPKGAEFYCLGQDNTAKKTRGQQHFIHQVYFCSTCSSVTVSGMIAVLGPWAGKNMGFIVTGFKVVFYLRKFLTILELKFSQPKMEPCFSGLRGREGECPGQSGCYRCWLSSSDLRITSQVNSYEARFSFRTSQCHASILGLFFLLKNKEYFRVAAHFENLRLQVYAPKCPKFRIQCQFVGRRVACPQEPSHILNTPHNLYLHVLYCFQIFLRDFFFNIFLIFFLPPGAKEG